MRDPRLLSPESYTELFHPQLDQAAEQSLNDYFARARPCTRSSWHWASRTLSGRRGPLPVWCLDGQEAGGRFAKGTTFSAVVPSIEWFMDHETGICGTALCQILPPMHPAVIALHDKF